MPAELLTYFGPVMSPALEQGAISLEQAWSLSWALFVDEELTPRSQNLLRRVMLAAELEAPQEMLMH